jgi:hypothetical protein
MTVHKSKDGVYIKSSIEDYEESLTKVAIHDIRTIQRIDDCVEIHFNSEYRDQFKTGKLHDAKAFFKALQSAVLGIEDDEEDEEEKP